MPKTSTASNPAVSAKRLRRIINVLDGRRTLLHAAFSERRATLWAYTFVLKDLETALERARLRAQVERRA
jgi:hypothetical protein